MFVTVFIIACCYGASSSMGTVEDVLAGNASSLCRSMGGASFMHSCYVVSDRTKRLNWANAFDQCQAHNPIGFNGRLAWFLSKESWEYVSKNWPGYNVNQFWIGQREVDDNETRDSVYWWKDKRSRSLKVDWAPDRHGRSTRLNYDDVGHKCFRTRHVMGYEDAWADADCARNLRYVCEYVADPCYYMNPCLNDAICKPSIIYNPKCICLKGYEGDTCQIEIPIIGAKSCQDDIVITIVISTLMTIVLMIFGICLYKKCQLNCPTLHQ